MKIEFYKEIAENNPSYQKEAIAWIRIQSLASKRLDLQAIACLQAIAYRGNRLDAFDSRISQIYFYNQDDCSDTVL